MRERRSRRFAGEVIARITPACAGKTNSVAERANGNLGSPPHVRERRRYHCFLSIRHRITPACAGKTSDVWHWPFPKQDHPRMCGKDPARPLGTTATWGSPPHVRERHVVFTLRRLTPGITPACAGKTVMDPFIFALLRLPTFKIYLISLLNI